VGTLYLVATPIGNLEDITLRALRMLKQVDLIAAEDTRRTRKLLSHYEISTPITSYHEHNKWSKLEEILTTLGSGDVALVSDAGTPALNDPGYELVRACLERGFSISSIPGPSAPVAALVVSGLPTDAFLYLGYPPRKAAERHRLFVNIADLNYTLIFLEAPHRLVESLNDLLKALGDRQISVTRELTKMHEQTFRGLISEAKAYFTAQPPRGEFTLILSGMAPTATQRWSEDRLLAAIRTGLDSGGPAPKTAAQLARTSGWPRREVYRLIREAQSTMQPREET
jgi:16S rRNA (cytidine1402-2'-O)-methyltransferase